MIAIINGEAKAVESVSLEGDVAIIRYNDGSELRGEVREISGGQPEFEALAHPNCRCARGLR